MTQRLPVHGIDPEQLAEFVRDTVASALVAGTNVTITVDDAGNTITLAAGGGGSTDPEVVRDTIAAALVAGSGISISVDDAGDTITIASTGGGGSGGASGTLLLEWGGSVPAGTPSGTIVFRKQQDSTAAQAAIAADAPAVQLTLNETTGNWLDISGNARHFTPGAGVQRGLPPLINDGGFAAAGSGTAPIGTLAANAAITGASSIEAVVGMPTSDVKGTIGKIGTPNTGWEIGLGSGSTTALGRQLVLTRSGIAYVTTGYTFPSGAGNYRVIATYNGAGGFTVFVNGSQVYSGSPGTINAPGAALKVGDDNNSQLSSTVTVDDVAFYSTALSAARALAHGSVAGNSGRAIGWWDGTTLRPLA